MRALHDVAGGREDGAVVDRPGRGRRPRPPAARSSSRTTSTSNGWACSASKGRTPWRPSKRIARSSIRSVIGRPPSRRAASRGRPRRPSARPGRSARTSWTRTMSTPAATPRTVVATVASTRSPGGRSRTLPSVDFRDVPRRTGRPSARSSGELARGARGCATGALPKPKPGIDDQPLPRHAGTDGPLDRPLEVGDDLGHEGRVAGLGPVVHEHERDAVLGGDPGDGVVVGHAPDVVDEVGPGVERRRGDGRLRRVDRERHVRQRRAEGPDHGHDAGDLVGRVDRRVARAATTRRRRRGGRRLRRPSAGRRAPRPPPPGSSAGRPGGRRRRTSRG